MLMVSPESEEGRGQMLKVAGTNDCETLLTTIAPDGLRAATCSVKILSGSRATLDAGKM